MAKTEIFIGTSGWSYDHWKGVFYPESLASSQWLHYYAQHFCIVEINSTFYRLPTENAIRNWVAKTSPKFLFAVKAHRWITHIKRLKDYERSTRNFFRLIALFEYKLGPILFQLSPSFPKEIQRLEAFIKKLPKDYRFAFEFRHPSWNCDETYDCLRAYNIAWCISDLEGTLSPLEVTSNFVYIRLHGPKKAYQGSYSQMQLKKWEEQIREWKMRQISTYCFFDNDEKGYAVQNAMQLQKKLRIKEK